MMIHIAMLFNESDMFNAFSKLIFFIILIKNLISINKRKLYNDSLSKIKCSFERVRS